MIFEPLETADGSQTLRHPVHGEPYHARDGARSEALNKFVVPSDLSQRLRRGPVRLLDIGFGLGINTRMALECAVETSGYPLYIDSLEIERDALVRARSLFPEDPLLSDLLATGCHLRPPHRVQLHFGDARVILPTLDGGWDLIFHDPFSPLRNTECWTLDFFALLRRKIHPGGALLSYSQSRVVRAGLAAAGWQVEDTPAVPPQRGGIRALPSLPSPPETLPWRDPGLCESPRIIRARREAHIRQLREVY